VPFAIYIHSAQQSRDAVWNAKLGGSREHVMPPRVGALLEVWLVPRNFREIWHFFKKCAAKFFP